jgi:hypothetical protein
VRDPEAEPSLPLLTGLNLSMDLGSRPAQNTSANTTASHVTVEHRSARHYQNDEENTRGKRKQQKKNTNLATLALWVNAV